MKPSPLSINTVFNTEFMRCNELNKKLNIPKTELKTVTQIFKR